MLADLEPCPSHCLQSCDVVMMARRSPRPWATPTQNGLHQGVTKLNLLQPRLVFQLRVRRQSLFALALSSATAIPGPSTAETSRLSSIFFLFPTASRPAAASASLKPPHLQSRAFSSTTTTSTMSDPRESSSYSIIPRIRYNTIGGINGPLVILDKV